jgi:hypothetical protein
MKCIFGWIAFAKQPLRKLEFLSAVSFSEGIPQIENLAPQYILDICGPLIEERSDSTLSFIHVSVKEYVPRLHFDLNLGFTDSMQFSSDLNQQPHNQ